jgi:type II secretory pathway pseudopilin PulG
VELLVVLVIIAILSSVAVGLVNRYSNLARVSAAKAVVISAARECVRWLVDSEGRSFARGTSAGEGLVLSPANEGICGLGTTFQVTIEQMPGVAYRVIVNSDGSLVRECSGSFCPSGLW